MITLIIAYVLFNADRPLQPIAKGITAFIIYFTIVLFAVVTLL